MPDFQAIIFDFDGVLLESEFEGNRELAALLTEFGHEHRVEDTLRLYVGLNPALRGAAGRSVLAHLVDLIGRDIVAADGPATVEARYRPRHAGRRG